MDDTEGLRLVATAVPPDLAATDYDVFVCSDTPRFRNPSPGLWQMSSCVGPGRMAVRVEPSPRVKPGQVYVGTLARRNLGVKLGEEVRLLAGGPTCVVDGIAVDISPVGELLDKGPVAMSCLRCALVGRTLFPGQRFSVYFIGAMHLFDIVAFTPAPAADSGVAVGPNTAIRIVEPGEPATANMAPGNTDKAGGDAGSAGVFESVGGLEKQRTRLLEVVQPPLENPGIFADYGITPPRGVLLFGPPGTGKTLLARTVGRELDAKLFVVNGPEVVGKYYGESEAALKNVFLKAQEAAPSIVFIDELDGLCPAGQSEGGAGRQSAVDSRLVTTLCSLFDDAAVMHRVVVLAATNRPNGVDGSLRRPGRFDVEIEMESPNEVARRDILRVLTKGLPHGLSDSDVEHFASVTHGYVGADLSALCKEAFLCALKRCWLSPGPDASKVDSAPSSIADVRVGRGDMAKALQTIKPSAVREVLIDVPKVKWTDIGGQQETIASLKEAIEWPLKHPDAFERLGIRPPRGILLYGPPGCSKTLLAKALATECGLNFIAIKGPELFSKWVGESERAVREVFRKARAAAPSIVFFDEVDSLSAERGSSDAGGVADRVLSQLLNEMDGVEKIQNVVVVAATNRPDMMDKALLRPGRIDRLVYVGLPDLEARREILGISTRGMPLHSGVDLDGIAARTEGYSGAELVFMCQEAAFAAVSRNEAASAVEDEDFTTALSSVQPRTPTSLLRIYEEYRAGKFAARV